ncbi:glycosyltransferase family 1 protein [Fulvimarina endophytica]|uniref:Glycosyltransferase family 1 protein n=1 Tax=Fulvimarina endophytica TaxID=2293836 RepID=A0A371X3K3_9HYPH|nr:glycosyltransferase family 4 protein [Fulvimarina endophytica]RFC63805.1 glycosyltransferase family 1 protein [Fulvimarina endophytica]
MSRTLVFVVTEDWFFVSHFLPMLRSARRAGFEPVVITRVREHRGAIEAAGGRVIALEADRRNLNPLAILKTVRRLAAILRAEDPRFVHCIALRSILVGGLAARLSGRRHCIFAVTGGGFLMARTDLVGRATIAAIAFVMRRILGRSRTQFLFENEDDPKRLGLSPRDPDVTIVGGAGVDPDHYRPTGRVPDDRLRVAVVSRMLWSKGVDLVVEAVTRARASGARIELALYGAPDPANPRSIATETLAEWSGREGIFWHGPTDDPRKVWAENDVACLASRGGEGLPRTLLEAAACGRALVTTDVPGCRSFVRDGVDGFVVPPNDAEALKRALERLAGDRDLVERMQRESRARVLDGFTEDAVSAKVEAMYGR